MVSPVQTSTRYSWHFLQIPPVHPAGSFYTVMMVEGDLTPTCTGPLKNALSIQNKGGALRDARGRELLTKFIKSLDKLEREEQASDNAQ